METMKQEQTKPNKPPEKKRDALTAELADMPGIPVRELRFCVQGGRDLDLPGSNGGFNLLRVKGPTGGGMENLEITFLPKVLLYRVVHSPKNQAVKTIYVPREWATFEPLE